MEMKTKREPGGIFVALTTCRVANEETVYPGLPFREMKNMKNMKHMKHMKMNLDCDIVTYSKLSSLKNCIYVIVVLYVSSEDLSGNYRSCTHPVPPCTQATSLCRTCAPFGLAALERPITT